MSQPSYAPLRAGAAADIDDTSTSSPETLTVSTVAAAAVGAVGHHLLKVEGYSRLKRMHGGTGSSYIKSGEFTAGGHAWRIQCYLNGEHEEEAGHVSLYVFPAVAPAGIVHAEFEVELLHHHGAAAPWPFRGRVRAVPFRAGRKWGYPKFIAVKDLERRFLRDDCFGIRCSVTVVEERAAAEEDVTAEDMDRVGVVCPCKDGSCQFKHERPAETLWEKIALICRFICGEASS
ncbi:unnamed protein product [Urochloa decumbens]|uniref:MATH domain-containing protein n=1 Tax=Urochloa decumbens TaxID=240449 RepID=A0ABC9FLJ6_9POAL